MPASKSPDASGDHARKPSADATGSRASNIARRRQRLAANSGGNRLSRPLAAALIVLVAGGTYLFWPRGGTIAPGIGEQITVITADSLAAKTPRSGSVDIEAQHQPLVAEKPDRSSPSASQAPATVTGQTAAQPPAEPISAHDAARTQAGTTAAPAHLAPATAMIQPQPTGRWAVQVGAYGSEANAESVVGQLKTKGIEAQVRGAGTASGEIIYRVWIGWFQSRDQALAYAAQEKERIGEAHPVAR